ncbi:MAG: anaerobic glycerol-3-phosphate dehydrogenase subunit GlpA [Bacteroidetes bacterium HLUCCA01]|nr:MAG: anaerobic glycerol-3-phosphate dehydrogenase subunit GlpA [Bacteroidetes bacterium HLUCCA01]
MVMNRQKLLKHLDTAEYWDIIVIGGGATGLGVAVDAASRGYKTLLLEMHDFSKATSSRSTKLVHGGVRYLQQGDVSLVIEALKERGLLIQNAPHLVTNQAFIVPSYDWWNGPFYGVGMKVYDLLAGKLGLGPSKLLSLETTLERIPTIEKEGLRGGVVYYDGQFDDARLAVNLAQTVHDHGGIPLNYMKVTGLLKSPKGYVTGVKATDGESGKEYELSAHVVINATGIFTDDIVAMDEDNPKPMIAFSQGVHLVLDKEFLPGDTAIMVPHTDDGRVLFAVPWHDKVIVGTTDTPVPKAELEPRPLEEEVEFILRHAAKYMSKDPERKDVKSAFAGLRPLVKPPENKNTAQISRSHHLQVSTTGLVTITGGKWTTYRKMAEDTVDQALAVAGLQEKKCVTEHMRIHGWLKNVDRADHLHVYGSDIVGIKNIIAGDASMAEKLHKDLPYIKAEVVWSTRNEMARTVEDVLSRRMRAQLLDARASLEMAAEVARIMADELGKDEQWQKDQIAEYAEVTRHYVLD